MTLTSKKMLEMSRHAQFYSHAQNADMILDNSLTSLSWLQNLKVLDLVTPDVSTTIPISPNSEEGYSIESTSTNASSSPPDRKPYDASVGVSLSPIRKCLMQTAEYKSAPRKYRNDSSKPPFSHTTLIYLAMLHNKSGRVTLSEIYRWIRLNFKFYRLTDSSWESSIRHNLSLNELFVKAPQANGKGSFWSVNPDYSHTIMETSSSLSKDNAQRSGRKRAVSSGQDPTKTTKMRKRRIKSENACPPDPCGLPGDLDWVSLLSSQRLGCGSCPSQSCRPSFGSPVLGTPDLGHIGDPVVCSPLVIPVTTAASNEPVEIPATPLVGVNRGTLLEEAVLKQDSPPLDLLPWDESRPQSPCTGNLHPWAESREKTLHEMRNLSKMSKPTIPTCVRSSMWSPESSWSSSSTYSTAGLQTKAPLLSEACIY